MMTTRLAIAVFVVAGLAMPFAAEAKKSRHVRHHVSTMQSGTSLPVGAPITQPPTFGSSGPAIGTVTAPSIGAYTWPSVGVTNARPTWSNTNPPVR